MCRRNAWPRPTLRDEWETRPGLSVRVKRRSSVFRSVEGEEGGGGGEVPEKVWGEEGVEEMGVPGRGPEKVESE